MRLHPTRMQKSVCMALENMARGVPSGVTCKRSCNNLRGNWSSCFSGQASEVLPAKAK